MVEQLTFNQLVAGSNPAGATIFRIVSEVTKCRSFG